MAFKPGELIYQYDVDKRDELVGKLATITSSYESVERTKWELEVHHIVCTGKELAYMRRTVTIERYEGYKPLTELCCFPLKYHPDNQNIEKALIARGKRYVALLGIHHRQYTGRAEFYTYSRKPVSLFDTNGKRPTEGLEVSLTIARKQLRTD